MSRDQVTFSVARFKSQKPARAARDARPSRVESLRSASSDETSLAMSRKPKTSMNPVKA